MALIQDIKCFFGFHKMKLVIPEQPKSYDIDGIMRWINEDYAYEICVNCGFKIGLGEKYES